MFPLIAAPAKLVPFANPFEDLSKIMHEEVNKMKAQIDVIQVCTKASKEKIDAQVENVTKAMEVFVQIVKESKEYFESFKEVIINKSHLTKIKRSWTKKVPCGIT